MCQLPLDSLMLPARYAVRPQACWSVLEEHILAVEQVDGLRDVLWSGLLMIILRLEHNNTGTGS